MGPTPELHEISDLIIAFGPGGERLPVDRRAVLDRLGASGQAAAARIVERISHRDQLLCTDSVDGILLRSHRELQRLNEEFHQGRRLLEVLGPAVEAVRAVRSGGPIRVVDVGCGIGYIVRWLAAHDALGPDVELVGYDLNAVLLTEARALATRESLRCEFVQGDALAAAEPADIFISSGVLHHFRGDALSAFVTGQSQALACFHFDIEPSWLAPVGARLFHYARMREPLARHDGVVSALRAHPRETLIEAARGAQDAMRFGFFRVSQSALPLTRTLRPLCGVRTELWEAWCAALGPLQRLLWGWA